MIFRMYWWYFDKIGDGVVWLNVFGDFIVLDSRLLLIGFLYLFWRVIGWLFICVYLFLEFLVKIYMN